MSLAYGPIAFAIMHTDMIFEVKKKNFKKGNVRRAHEKRFTTK